MYVYICQDGGAVGFIHFTKLLFALSSPALYIAAKRGRVHIMELYLAHTGVRQCPQGQISDLLCIIILNFAVK